MAIESVKCPNCGANLKFNSRTHQYECGYCKTVFKDPKANEKGDPRVELRPEDLETLKPVKKGSKGNSQIDVPTGAVLAFTIIFSIIMALFIFVVWKTFSMMLG